MQQNQKTIVEKCSIGICGTAWVAGLLIAGSDSSYMPWFNGVGLLLFFGASFLLGRLLNSSHLNAGIMIRPGFYLKSKTTYLRSKKRNQRVNIRYALES